MTARFTDSTVIITGAGSGLGQATAERLAAEGANLVLVDMNAEGLEATKKLVTTAAPEARVELITADVTRPEDVENYVQATVKTFGSIDGFFNNAGIEGAQNLTEEFGTEEFAKVIAVNLNGVVGLTREYGQFGIRINAIAPGAIMTAMVENSLKQMDPDNWEAAGEQFVSVNPMKRFGKPEEVAGLVSFLLSEDAGFINGTVVPIDGGQHAMY